MGRHRWVVERTDVLAHAPPQPRAKLRFLRRTLHRVHHYRVCAELSPPTTRTRQMRHSLMMLKTFLGVIEDESGLHTVPANRAGHLPQLPQRPQPRTVVAEVAAVRRRSGRKCGQAHPADTRTSASTGTTRALRARQGNLSHHYSKGTVNIKCRFNFPAAKGG